MNILIDNKQFLTNVGLITIQPKKGIYKRVTYDKGYKEYIFIGEGYYQYRDKKNNYSWPSLESVKDDLAGDMKKVIIEILPNNIIYIDHLDSKPKQLNYFELIHSWE